MLVLQIIKAKTQTKISILLPSATPLPHELKGELPKAEPEKAMASLCHLEV